LFIYLFIYLFVCLFVCLSACLLVCLPVCLFTLFYLTLPYFTLIYFTSLHFTSLPFTSFHFSSLYFPVKNLPAAFQQTFQFKYVKTEEGECAQPLAAYGPLLQPAVSQAQRLLSKTCFIKNNDNELSGTLVISDIQEISANVSW
jgi:hypothetical protein